MNKIINVYVNDNHTSLSTSLTVQKKFEEKGFTISYTYDENADLNLCIGGDGAFLRAVHQFHFSNIPYVGINTGHLGFYQEILVPNIDRFIDQFIHGQYRTETLALLESTARIRNSSQEFMHRALNEFVVKTNNNSIIYLDVFIDDHFLESFAGDGLIFSTPSGSTAYNFSAGGAILYQNLDGFQITPIAAINSKSYRSLMHPLIVPFSSNVTVYLRGREQEMRSDQQALILSDGINCSYENIDHVNFTKSKTTIRRLVFQEDWYWMNIKDKFL